MIGKETLELLKEALSESSYTVAVCGSGMLEEGGILGPVSYTHLTLPTN